MASLTIRKLDEAIKIYLRVRAARNGRSVEEEVRGILREYTDGRLQPASPPPLQVSAPVPHPACGERAFRRARLYRPVRSRKRVRCRPYQAGTRLRPDRGGAGDRRFDVQDGARRRR